MTESSAAPSESARPVALVTGPTSGLGAAFARVLAEKGHDLVLVARDERRLTALAGELAATHNIEAEVLVADLGTEAGRDAAAARLTEGVDVLINNAGFATDTPFGEADIASLRDELAVNVTAVLELTHAAVPAMRKAGSGAIVNVASVGALLPGAAATYNGSKAWVIRFSEDLARQLAGSGIRVQALCPGLMDTPFHTRAGQDISGVTKSLVSSPDEVAETALADLAKGWIVSVPGRRYQLATALNRLKPRRLVWRL
ncbi:MAG: SDR family NAD(P)-dependent oxidoreductase [Rhodococcus sp. (in: high G+C Gram-positive bacteria)]|uniref:SDR family NAD(P)-dependent oxidoreductase n=1 Tax=Rhodococcus sp. TaxID=1831 RepID=UPI003BB69062